MENYIIIAALVLIVGLIIFYLIRTKKRNTCCIGCPYAKKCGDKCICNNDKGMHD